MNHPVMEINLDRCVGCHTCTVACQTEKGLEPDVTLIPVHTLGGLQDVAHGSLTAMYLDYLPRPCAHCHNPRCAGACPTGALYQRADGLVLMDESLCTGCRDCVPACPFGAITLDVDGIARKCDLCAARLDKGLEPFCVICCPTKALTTSPQPAISQGFIPGPDLGTEATLNYHTWDSGRRQRVSAALSAADRQVG